MVLFRQQEILNTISIDDIPEHIPAFRELCSDLKDQAFNTGYMKIRIIEEVFSASIPIF